MSVTNAQITGSWSPALLPLSGSHRPSPSFLAIVLLAAMGATGCGQSKCGDGTHDEGGTCVADTTTDGLVADGGAATLPPVGDGADAGVATDASTTDPPIEDPPIDDPPADDGSPDRPPRTEGCDATAGECERWAAAIAMRVGEQQIANGCDAAPTLDDRISAVAQRHAQYQASIDRLDASSPDGPLFEQVHDAGVTFMTAASLFSMTLRGPADVVNRWANRADTNVMLMRCDAAMGIGVATSAGGSTYVTVLLVDE